ncbi:MAG TPA: hypothetical protein VI612_04675 [Candidatus Nanoarchaeia archaeon]|nr:hypothetical protein [Candidatus Nanoarchaeia archaeon]
MKKTSITLLLLLMLACQVQPQVKGVLEGTLSVGPICPVERIPPDPSCQPTAETFQAWPIAVFEGKHKVTNVVVKSDGTFSVELPPGTYVVDLEKQQHFGKGTLPATVVVKSGETISINIDIDTGIR